ncbi:MAG TPA: hypothetical protein VGX91_09885 [Candidatus Cybelea sp.]|nr:hypothetical protein [Candidatus Cybelea sp.]
MKHFLPELTCVLHDDPATRMRMRMPHIENIMLSTDKDMREP